MTTIVTNNTAMLVCNIGDNVSKILNQNTLKILTKKSKAFSSVLTRIFETAVLSVPKRPDDTLSPVSALVFHRILLKFKNFESKSYFRSYACLYFNAIETLKILI